MLLVRESLKALKLRKINFNKLIFLCYYWNTKVYLKYGARATFPQSCSLSDTAPFRQIANATPGPNPDIIQQKLPSPKRHIAISVEERQGLQSRRKIRYRKNAIIIIKFPTIAPQ
jgi:hypothetical protein